MDATQAAPILSMNLKSQAHFLHDGLKATSLHSIDNFGVPVAGVTTPDDRNACRLNCSNVFREVITNQFRAISCDQSELSFFSFRIEYIDKLLQFIGFGGRSNFDSNRILNSALD